MRIFITGATGFIGGRLAHRLKEAGHIVIALARPTGDTRALRAAGIEIADGDITDSVSLAGSMKGVDRVYHVAAWYEIGAADAAGMRRVNVEGTRNVLAEALRQRVPNILYCGTVATLGPSRNGPGDESQANDGLFRSHYESTKIEAHKVALEYAAQGLPIRIAMPSAVYGPGDTSLIGWTLRLFVKGLVRVCAFPDARLTFTHVDDTAAGLELAAEKGRVGETYVVAGQILSFREWMDTMSHVSGIPAPRIWLKGNALRRAAPFLGPLARLAGLPARVAEEGVAMADSWAFKSEKARRELGWNPRSAEAGFAETLEWFRGRYAPRRRFTSGIPAPNG